MKFNEYKFSSNQNIKREIDTQFQQRQRQQRTTTEIKFSIDGKELQKCEQSICGILLMDIFLKENS